MRPARPLLVATRGKKILRNKYLQDYQILLNALDDHGPLTSDEMWAKLNEKREKGPASKSQMKILLQALSKRRLLKARPDRDGSPNYKYVLLWNRFKRRDKTVIDWESQLEQQQEENLQEDDNATANTMSN